MGVAFAIVSTSDYLQSSFISPYKLQKNTFYKRYHMFKHVIKR